MSLFSLSSTTRSSLLLTLLLAPGLALFGCASKTMVSEPMIPPGGPPCTTPVFHWSATVPPVNQLHVFCGEIKGTTPKGFHSLQELASSPVVTGVNPHGGAGIYNATVTFAPPAAPNTKMSTFFPDACTVAQIVTSIVYAANNQTGPHPVWGVLGPSAPLAGGAAYCLNGGAPFPIRMGLLANGNVNTAFPN